MVYIYIYFFLIRYLPVNLASNVLLRGGGELWGLTALSVSKYHLLVEQTTRKKGRRSQSTDGPVRTVNSLGFINTTCMDNSWTLRHSLQDIWAWDCMFQETESLITCSSILFSLQPKLLAKELLDLVASHFNLKEKEYFGIAFTDET